MPRRCRAAQQSAREMETASSRDGDSDGDDGGGNDDEGLARLRE